MMTHGSHYNVANSKSSRGYSGRDYRHDNTRLVVRKLAFLMYTYVRPNFVISPIPMLSNSENPYATNEMFCLVIPCNLRTYTHYKLRYTSKS